MRIVSWPEFAALPAGTIFTYFGLPEDVRGPEAWSPSPQEALYRKGETLFADDGRPIDFYEAALTVDVNRDDDAPYFDPGEGRWGLFDYDQVFAVFDQADVDRLLAILVTPKPPPA